MALVGNWPRGLRRLVDVAAAQPGPSPGPLPGFGFVILLTPSAARGLMPVCVRTPLAQPKKTCFLPCPRRAAILTPGAPLSPSPPTLSAHPLRPPSPPTLSAPPLRPPSPPTRPRQDGRNVSRDVFLAPSGRGGAAPSPTNSLAVTCVCHAGVPLLGLYITYGTPLPASLLNALISKVCGKRRGRGRAGQGRARRGGALLSAVG